MKKSIFFTVLIIVPIISFSQQTTTPVPVLTKSDYLQKSKNQKAYAWILLGSGAVIFGITAPGFVSLDILGPLVVIGAVATLVSIPLFIAAAKNKRRAGASTVLLTMETTPQLQNCGFANQLFPSLKLKISL